MDTVRKVKLTAKDKTCINIVVALPGNPFNPPSLIQYKGLLYKTKGSGGFGPVNFYHEEIIPVVNVPDSKEYARLEFLKLDVTPEPERA